MGIGRLASGRNVRWSEPWWVVVLVAVSLSGTIGCNPMQSGKLSPDDRQAMRNAASSYATAWLSNDPEKVMASFVPEPVLSPSGIPFVEGQKAARNFWWPEESPPTRVTEFLVTEQEAGGSGDFGFVRGTYRLVFEYSGATHVNTGKYLSLLKKMSDGSWRISHHFWNDLPQGDE